MNHLFFNRKIFIQSFLIFPFLVIVGTLTHELGHIAIAEILGYETILHYGSMSWFANGHNGDLTESNTIIFLITLGGVLQTIITGSLGIYYIRKKRKKYSFTFWLGVYLSLFWSREVINLLMSITNGILYKQNYFGGDERILSELLNLPVGFFSIGLGILGMIICVYTIFKIDIKDRLSFLIAGLISGILTYIVWFSFIGTLILP